MRSRAVVAGAACLLLAACSAREDTPMVVIPGGRVAVGSRNPASRNPPRETEVAPFRIAATETTVVQFILYLNSTGGAPGIEPHPQMARHGAEWKPAPGCARLPVVAIARGEADAYCAWMSRRFGRRVRLPTEDEWETAARGGLRGADWPWGWGDPRGKAVMDASGPATAGSLPPNPYGLHDMAGNVFEWCSGETPLGIPARGGAWSERDASMGKVHSRAFFRADYRGCDTGFRVAMD
ncbi:MAG: formylglycine-generating enzyme family protein [Verrucomicrobia bacterium]|nr:formylglycine-generating enzyme family protein [Verrucomicrobiota bacterium]